MSIHNGTMKKRYNMKHLIIRDFGPLKTADIELERINLIIGLQGSGKSCVMMVASYCSWIEKRIMLRQSVKEFQDGTTFLDGLISYYHAKGYIHINKTYIEYSSNYMTFSYDCATEIFSHSWNKNRWDYRRPKVSYVPAERNLVSLVANWNRLETSYDSILDFKADWDTARKYMKREEDILGTGISYEYDEVSGTDSVVTSNGTRLGLMNSSSGFQSLVPMFVHLDYLYRGIYDDEKRQREKTYSERQFIYNLIDIIYRRNHTEDINIDVLNSEVVHIEGKDFVFQEHRDAEKFKADVERLLYTDHSDVFLEEPECNLFPPTQAQLVNWIIEMYNDPDHSNSFFIATHSSYILSYLLQENIRDFKLFLTHKESDGFMARTASEDDIQEIYDNGSDAFFNLGVFGKK